MLWHQIQQPRSLCYDSWYSNLAYYYTTLYNHRYSKLPYDLMLLLIQNPITSLYYNWYSNSWYNWHNNPATCYTTLIIDTTIHDNLYNTSYSNICNELPYSLIQQSMTNHPTTNTAIYYITILYMHQSKQQPMIWHSEYKDYRTITTNKATARPLLEDPRRCAYQERLGGRQTN